MGGERVEKDVASGMAGVDIGWGWIAQRDNEERSRQGRPGGIRGGGIGLRRRGWRRGQGGRGLELIILRHGRSFEAGGDFLN